MIDSNFFEGDLGIVTVSGKRYRIKIKNFLLSQINELYLESLSFKQNHATIHTAQSVVETFKILDISDSGVFANKPQT